MKIVEILKIAVAKDASDVILSPDTKPAIKIDGEIVFLEDYEIYKSDELSKDILSMMNDEQKQSFSRKLELDFSLERSYSRFRGNAFVQKNGLGIVFRPIKKKLQELDLPKRIIDFTKKKAGIIIVTGAVGSGKSTTLATLIEHINNNYSKHIITVEDPIEYVFSNNKSIIEQREVGINTNNFDNGIKYALRQSSDVIMVGEMRDLETFRLALRAAETGNLVLATMHTSGAAESISRIINMFPEGEKEQIKTQISEVLIGVVWQTLVKKVGGGRAAAIELLVNNTTISNMIRKGLNHQIDGVIETGKEDGMITMKKSLEELLTNGVISEETFKENQENHQIK